MNVSVIVVTMNRPECVRQCLECLAAQTRAVEQVIVVDASKDDRTRKIVAGFPPAGYLRNEQGAGHMTASRNIGLLHSTGRIVAFIDDDAYAQRDWLERLLEVYQDETIAAVGGRAIQGNRPPEPWVEVARIGKLLPHGELYAGFDTDAKEVLAVDHMIGCNMSFRRGVLARLGGFRDDFPGTEVCEESDISLRIRRLGLNIRYQPAAVVRHVGAPQFKGRRFDARYNYYSAHNNSLLLIRNYGFFSGIYRRFLLRSLMDRIRDWFGAFRGATMRSLGGASLRFIAYKWGLMVGALAGLRVRLVQGKSPLRNDVDGVVIRKQLSTDTMPKEQTTP